MKVSPSQAFEIIYSLYQHEYLGYLFESFVVQLDERGNLTYQNQNISSKNAKEFSAGLDDADFTLIDLMDGMQQDKVISKFSKRKQKPEDFFLKIYDKEKGNKDVQQEIYRYLERRRARILELMYGKRLFEMGNDGEPTWREIEIMPEKATVLFHFRKNEDNTHYFPTIKYDGEKLNFQYKAAFLVCKEPAWMVLAGKLYSFAKQIDGNKLLPFLNKKFIVIPKKVEETYYRKFISPLVASFDVFARGFEIKTSYPECRARLLFSPLQAASGADLFEQNGDSEIAEEKIVFKLQFIYDSYEFLADNLEPVSVEMEKSGEEYTFYRIGRKPEEEREIIQWLISSGLPIRNSTAALPVSQAMTWIRTHGESWKNKGHALQQKQSADKNYYLGPSTLSVEIRENIDWFDVHTIVRFGDYEIPFSKLRRLMMKKKNEIELPNGQIAVIPQEWFSEYAELFAFVDGENEKNLTLRKHHLALVNELKNSNLAQVTMDRKLEKLRNFVQIEDQPVPAHFKGELRPYQKAGYNWLRFLEHYNFGGCLADDMGLGKTIQTLAMLQSEKERDNTQCSLIVMPTSLIYNWEKEASRFTPKLDVLIYRGTQRVKEVAQFDQYDLVLTSYGIVRLDLEILQEYFFNYIILDESQVIKNPSSNISKAVRKLHSRQRLILTGTPLENSTLDLWSQMSFLNPGLLGSQGFFKNEFQKPIEKKKDEDKTFKLNTIIKPFILRRHKSQVATELPEKVENIHYSTMTTMQEETYEKVKSEYRNMILDNIEQKKVKNSQFILLKGLTQLRQIASHPRLVDAAYKGDSGKTEDILYMLQNAIGKDHSILVFSQFVKHLNLVREYLNKLKINYAYLDGSTKDRQQEVDRFQEQEHTQLFLISLKAGGLGLNLTKADYVFLLDPWWNPAIEAQAIDRAHRIGQENKVFTYKFITKNTVEEKILELQQKKKKLASDLITTEESFIKSLSTSDIDSLLS